MVLVGAVLMLGLLLPGAGELGKRSQALQAGRHSLKQTL